MDTEPYRLLQIYRAPSGQWSGQLIEDGEEAGRVAGCASSDEVVEAAYDQGWQGFEVIEESTLPSTTQKLASYETALEIFNMLIAGHAARIAGEKAKATPDESRLAQWRSETLAWRQQSNALAFDDAAAIEHVIKTLGPVVRANR